MSNRASVSPAKILIVDQNPLWTKWATQVLVTDGYDVRAVSSLEEAVDLLQHNFCELVLLGADIAKEQTGIINELAKRSQDPIRFLIVFPVRPSYSLLRLLWKAGASEILPKPYDRKELLAMIASEFQIEENARWHSNRHQAIRAPAGNR